MPHIVLEYTDNISDKIHFEQVFSSLHSILHDLAGADLGSCKSRAIKLSHYFIGDGTEGHAFVHLDIKLLEGRSLVAKQQVGKAALALLEQHFQSADNTLNVQATVKISDMPIELYFKSQYGRSAEKPSPVEHGL